MRVLSLFDGMACGMLAMLESGIDVERYVAFEIDKYAIQSATHNFPMIEERGDVFEADFTEFRGFDFLVGGSPCTYWSIAQKNNRETEASGMGWELFSQYVRALHEAKPRYFVYENNKSMSTAIRESITRTFGFEPICINSSLVSAQNRQRLYWVGKLTVSECKRLQTVPDWYEFPVSDTRAYQQLGNGWTILVISHLLAACLRPAKAKDEPYCDSDGNYRFF